MIIRKTTTWRWCQAAQPVAANPASSATSSPIHTVRQSREVMPGQGQNQDRDPRGQEQAAAQQDQQPDPPAAADPLARQRVGQVHEGKRAGELKPLVEGHLAQFSLVDHILILRQRACRAIAGGRWRSDGEADQGAAGQLRTGHGPAERETAQGTVAQDAAGHGGSGRGRARWLRTRQGGAAQDAAGHGGSGRGRAGRSGRLVGQTARQRSAQTRAGQRGAAQGGGGHAVGAVRGRPVPGGRARTEPQGQPRRWPGAGGVPGEGQEGSGSSASSADAMLSHMLLVASEVPTSNQARSRAWCRSASAAESGPAACARSPRPSRRTPRTAARRN